MQWFAGNAAYSIAAYSSRPRRQCNSRVGNAAYFSRHEPRFSDSHNTEVAVLTSPAQPRMATTDVASAPPKSPGQGGYLTWAFVHLKPPLRRAQEVGKLGARVASRHGCGRRLSSGLRDGCCHGTGLVMDCLCLAIGGRQILDLLRGQHLSE